MGSKRKKPNMALMPPEVSTDDRSPDQSSDGPRRSGRLLGRANQITNPKSAKDLILGGKLEPGQSKLKNRQLTGTSGEELAMSGLQEMENQLRSEVKRQKLAVQESEVQPSRYGEQQAAFLPRPIKAEPDVLPADMEIEALAEGMGKPRTKQPGHENKAQLKAEEVDQKLPDRDDAELILEDNDIKVAKQEGARPPPVNSGYLPLPWKGRLGYVNNSRHHGCAATEDRTAIY
ncbi:hypothetical protein NUW58_g4096 [Xylaria curta]|uniref:Uncharacterized protein n=1 Tax=Xylaria curta TaxID=42375 RepID=A0ACC1P954_9PEZI|nr:hypothetical protein NUW58_g4096 [Xylaria curta]